MLGIFDSGTGGHNALSVLRRYVKNENIILFTDRRNAPYGTKSRREILRITKENIKTLKHFGCRRVLVACCTASTLYPFLEEEQRDIATASLLPTAERVKAMGAKRVTLVATNHTVKDGSFIRALPDVALTQISAQPLVKLIDDGACDGRISPECRDYLTALLSKISDSRPEAVVLGCTHFHSIGKTIKKSLGVPVVSSAYEGAMAFLNNIKDEQTEEAKTFLLS